MTKNYDKLLKTLGWGGLFFAFAVFGFREQWGKTEAVAVVIFALMALGRDPL